MLRHTRYQDLESRKRIVLDAYSFKRRRPARGCVQFMALPALFLRPQHVGLSHDKVSTAIKETLECLGWAVPFQDSSC